MDKAEHMQVQQKVGSDEVSKEKLDGLFAEAHRLDGLRMKKPLEDRARLLDLLALFLKEIIIRDGHQFLRKVSS